MSALRFLMFALIAALGIHVGIGHHTGDRGLRVAPSKPLTQTINRIPETVVSGLPLLDLSHNPCDVTTSKHKTKTWRTTKHHKKKFGAHKPGKHKPGKHKPGNGHGKHHPPQPHPKKIPPSHLTGPPACK